MQSSKIIYGRAQPIAMVHVHSNNALSNTHYNSLFGVETYSSKELKWLTEIRKELLSLSKITIEETGIDILKYCRNASFVLKKQAIEGLEKKLCECAFVQQLIERALKEVEIYKRNGIKIIEIENIGAPYFIGNEVPLEDLLIQLVVAKTIRKNFPEINIGVHILSSDELESLPIAIACEAVFTRSESSVFTGLRPEGNTINKGNLAKFYYLRNYFNTINGVENPENRRLPAIWCDFQKKHTLFQPELNDLQNWLDNILFQKIEGVVLTGAETGSDIAEKDLAAARNSIHKTKEKINQLAGYTVDINIPLITGSGNNIEMYCKYADFIISGTALKENNYWENEVDEERVKKWLEKFDSK